MATKQRLIEAYAAAAAIRNLISPEKGLEESLFQLSVDASVLVMLEETRYLQSRKYHVPKLGQLPLLWEYGRNQRDHHRFIHLVRLSPSSFHALLELIEDHPVFTSEDSDTGGSSQAPTEIQLAITLYRMGRYGNGVSFKDVANWGGIGEGTVGDYTRRCLLAIESLQEMFVRKLTYQEKEREKNWVEKELGFTGGLCREGWVMYDGTIVVLSRKPEQHGDAYFTRKSNYGLNVQVCIDHI